MPTSHPEVSICNPSKYTDQFAKSLANAFDVCCVLHCHSVPPHLAISPTLYRVEVTQSVLYSDCLNTISHRPILFSNPAVVVGALVCAVLHL